MDEKLVALVVEEILRAIPATGNTPQTNGGQIPLEVSARHVHLSQKDVEVLFGAGHTLTPKRDLSQPGQFLCEERVRLVGPKGDFANVAVLGPARTETQAELSLTDARVLGIKAPLRMSGDLSGARDLLIMAGSSMVNAKGCAIAAKNHIHMTPEDAARFGVTDRQNVRVKVNSERPITFEEVAVRVSKDFALAMHIDFDEANACMADCSTLATLEGATGNTATPATLAPRESHCTPRTECRVGRVVTEEMAKQLCAGGIHEISLPPKTIVTPLAWDVFRAARVTVKAGNAPC